MSRFRDLGRSFERFKRGMEEAVKEEASHACRECGERLHAEREACPECGGEVVPLDSDP